jgi:hypothetical protein
MESKFMGDAGRLKRRASLQKLNVQEVETDIEAAGIEIEDTEVEAVADAMTAEIGDPTIAMIGGDEIVRTTAVIANATE